jgi:uncharacterized protein YebE (UPF0316 family)
MNVFQDQPELLALLIFFARILDVSIGTVRTILIFRGYRTRGAILGFFEILVWVVAVAQVIANLEEWYLVVAYAGGFAAGNYVGSWIESRLALGTEIVRAISRNPAVDLKRQLHRRHLDVVELTGRDPDDAPVEVLFVVESRRRVPALLRSIQEMDPEALCTISDVRIPSRRAPGPARWPVLRGGWRDRTMRK